MESGIHTESRPQGTIVYLKGDMDLGVVQQLQEVLGALLQVGETRVVVDCSAVTFFSSATAAVFVSALGPIRRAGGDIKFCCVGLRPRTVFDVLGLVKFVQYDLPSVDTALKAFASPLPPDWLGMFEEILIGIPASRVFHLPNCRTIPETSRDKHVEFETREEAIRSGWRPCKVCHA